MEAIHSRELRRRLTDKVAENLAAEYAEQSLHISGIAQRDVVDDLIERFVFPAPSSTEDLLSFVFSKIH